VIVTEFKCERLHTEDGKVVWIYVLPIGKSVGFKMYRDDLICCIKSCDYVFYMNAYVNSRCRVMVTRNEQGEEFLCSAYAERAEERLDGIPEAEE
jgi:hypothetical protein